MIAPLARRSLVVLRHCLGVRPGDHLAVITDGRPAQALIDATVSAAVALDAVPTVLEFPTEGIPNYEFGRFAEASLLEAVSVLPPPVLSGLASADKAVLFHDELAMVFDPEFRAVVGSEVVAAWMPYASPDEFLRLLPADVDEIEELVRQTQLLAERLSGGDRSVQLSSPAGTDLELRIGMHRINCSTGVPARGDGYGGLELWPGGQVAVVPDEGTARGRLVVDRSMNLPQCRGLVESIAFDVADGYVNVADGSCEAAQVRSYLAGLEHPEATHLTELGIGTNPRCRLVGRGGVAEDTHAMGCVSLALGADTHLGGEVAAPIHLDMTMHQATVAVDGEVLVEGGRLIRFDEPGSKGDM